MNYPSFPVRILLPNQPISYLMGLLVAVFIDFGTASYAQEAAGVSDGGTARIIQRSPRHGCGRWPGHGRLYGCGG